MRARRCLHLARVTYVPTGAVALECTIAHVAASVCSLCAHRHVGGCPAAPLAAVGIHGCVLWAHALDSLCCDSHRDPCPAEAELSQLRALCRPRDLHSPGSPRPHLQHDALCPSRHYPARSVKVDPLLSSFVVQ
eukprot:Amastigsp_a175939_292.p2 type:complete len:134 gc:universal Amastigsp_a175939_292:385-786(+)